MSNNTPQSITIVTGNRGKIAEISAIVGFPVEGVNIEILEIQSLSVEEVAREKAKQAFAVVQRPVVVDDTGMSIDALGGLPGALVAWFLDKIGPEGILKMMGGTKNRIASVSTAIGYADADGVHVFVGTVSGSIAAELRGTNGFGYDPIFIPDGYEKTYAEMTADEKNEKSMRSIALSQLRDFLRMRNQ